MFEAIVLICLTTGAQPCREVLLPGYEGETRAACEAALAISLHSNKTGSSYLGSTQSRRTDRVYRALALSNLGVLHAAKGSRDSARKSFREALQLETSLSAPRINLARLAKDETPSA